MRSKKAVWIIAAAEVLLLFFGSHIRTIQVFGQPVVLFKDPFFHGGSSIGVEIKASFAKEGKLADDVLDIAYIGTNSDFHYFECTYQEADGRISTYYAVEESDLNGAVRAAVLWERP